jgi:hypothetical protein
MPSTMAALLACDLLPSTRFLRGPTMPPPAAPAALAAGGTVEAAAEPAALAGGGTAARAAVPAALAGGGTAAAVPAPAAGGTVLLGCMAGPHWLPSAVLLSVVLGALPAAAGHSMNT